MKPGLERPCLLAEDSLDPVARARLALPAALLCAAWLAGCGGGGGGNGDGSDGSDGGGGDVTFSRDIAPVFAEKCTFCHHPNSALPDLTHPFDEQTGIVGKENSWVPNGSDKEFIVDPGNVDNSFILTKVSETTLEPEVEGAPMPFETAPLDDTQIAALTDWIDGGAADDASFEPVAAILGTNSMTVTRAAGKCAYCHYPDSPLPHMDVTDPFGPDGLVDVAADRGGTRVIPNNPDDSVLLLKVKGDTSEGPRMPFVPPRMSDREIADLTAWIAAGALDN